MWSVSKILILSIFLVCAAQGGILSNVFGSNMVLQRAPMSASLYGWSSKADTITVSFNGVKKYIAQSDNNGAWNVSLDPVAAGGPYSIFVNSAANSSLNVELMNVLFGDVILCSGQSNMQFTVNVGFNATEAFAAAGNYSTIRVFTVGQGNTSATPVNELLSIEQLWSEGSALAIGEKAGAFQYFSAVCWYTAVNIQNQFPDLPIGLISSNWGGTIIQAWSSPDAINNCPQTPSPYPNTNKMATSTQLYASAGFNSLRQPSPNSNSALWNAMIVPFLQMKLSAFLWYQAEANVGETDLYRCLFPAMINDWRMKWTLGDVPFFFAQLAPYTTDGPLPFPYSLADMRLAQTSGLSLPNVGLISTIDSGDIGSPFTNIHPRNKVVVGYRMFLAALSILYNVPYVVHSGPTLSSATVSSQYPNVAIILNFLPTTIGSGLELRPASCPVNLTFCSTWEVGLSDGTWQVGEATIVYNVAVEVKLASPANSTGLSVTGVRYLYSDWPVAPLFSTSSGLPASPFYFVFIQ